MAIFQTTANLNVRSEPGLDAEILDTLQAGDQVQEIDATAWCPIPMEDGSVGWVSRKYLIPAVIDTTVPAPAPAILSGEPVWIGWARKQLGQKEVSGPDDNPVIAAWYHLTTLPASMWHDATAWCAVFVNAAFMLNNIKTIRSARAVDWLTFGQPVTTPKKGDVVVFKWADGSHHVAFYLADAGSGLVQVLGGNQSDAVTITTYPKSNIMGYRRVT